MTNTKLILNMLAETSTTEISQSTNPSTLVDHKKIAKQGGGVAKLARKELEKLTNKNVVTSLNAKMLSKKPQISLEPEDGEDLLL